MASLSKLHLQRTPLFPFLTSAIRPTAILASLLPLLSAPLSLGQAAPSSPVDATALVRRAVQHRLESDQHHQPLQYFIRKVDTKHDTTKAIIETKDGDVARLVAIDGKPLSADIDRDELERLDDLAQHPELQEHRHRSEEKDQQRVTHMLTLLPDAFLYRMEGFVPCGATQCYRLSFTPNPHFVPPDIESNLYRGMAGEVWIEKESERMTRLTARSISDVDFGFGFLVKVNQGGTVQLEQTEVGGGDWEVTRLQVHVTGRELLVKPFTIQLTETLGNFSPAPRGIGYRDAIQLLKKLDPTHTTYTP